MRAPGQRSVQSAHRAGGYSSAALGRSVKRSGALTSHLILWINDQWWCQTIGPDGQEIMEPYEMKQRGM